MMRSMFAGVSALRNHQIQMDVIGNNIANVNTVGFKASRVTFQEVLSQTVRDASAPARERGGTNPIQVGLGSTLASITVQHSEGSPQTTGIGTDVSIQGNGFFVLANGSERLYTRAGMFDVDPDGSLVSVGGLRVMGWNATRDGKINVSSPIEAITLPVGATIDPQATSEIAFEGNLDARTSGTISFPHPTAQFTDGTGATMGVQFHLSPTGNFNEFIWSVSASGGAFIDNASNSFSAVGGRLVVDTDGNVESITLDPAVTGPVVLESQSGQTLATLSLPGVGDAVAFGWDEDGDGTPDQSVVGRYEEPASWLTTIRVYDSLGSSREVVTRLTKLADNEWEWRAYDENDFEIGAGHLEFDAFGRLVSQSGDILLPGQGGAAASPIVPDFSALTQFGEDATAKAVSQNGYAAGTLTGFGIDTRGVINGFFSNGMSRALGQLALATFSNPAGLRKSGETMFEMSANSGEARIGTAGSGNYGLVMGGTLEMSNVDLAREFTNMIITQRGFQANSRIITTSDEMLQELVNLKR